MEFKKIDINLLTPAGYNPRKALKEGDPEFEKIKKSIEEFGYVDPVIVNKDLTVIGGHQRISVLKTLGYTEIDCVVIEIDKTKEKALNIALNKISGEWDNAMLADLLKDLQVSDYDISLTGFDLPEIETLFNEMYPTETVEDECDIPLPENPISKQGDIWLLGRHRLLCGDSTKQESYTNLMDGKKANLVVTDPPYNINIEGGTKDKLKIQNDNMPDQDFYKFLLAFYKCTYEALADGGAIYVFHADTEGINFRTAFKEAGFHLSGVCIWVKNSLVLGRSDYHFRHEPILYGWKPTEKHNWYSDRKQSTIWNFDRPTKSEFHPTMKPVSLITYPITNSSMTNCIVLDPFGGSGTTLIACEQTGRICNMIEFDPKYVDVIVARFLSQVNSSDDIFLIRDGVKTKYAELEKEGLKNE